MKRKRNRLKNLPGKRDQALTKVEVIEKQIRQIELQYEDPEFFTRTSAADQQAQQVDRRRLHDELNQALAEWEALEAEIAALDQELAGLGSYGTE